MIERRVNINLAALEAKAKAAEPPISDETDFTAYDYTQRLWERFKPERNGLAAVIANSAFERTFAARQSGERGPYGLLQVDLDLATGYSREDPVVVTELPLPGRLEDRGDGFYQNIDKFTTFFERSMYSTARHDLRQEIDRRKDLPESDQERKEHDRLERLTTGFYDFEDFVYAEPVYKFISRGVSTATSAIGTTIRTIDYHYRLHNGKHISGEELAEVVRNSSRLHQRFASGNLHINSRAAQNLEDWRTGRFKEDVYLQGQPPRLDIPKDQWNIYRDNAQKNNFYHSLEQEQVTTGCPALASTDIVKSETASDEFTAAVPNVIRGMTNWAADILETL